MYSFALFLSSVSLTPLSLSFVFPFPRISFLFVCPLIYFSLSLSLRVSICHARALAHSHSRVLFCLFLSLSLSRSLFLFCLCTCMHVPKLGSLYATPFVRLCSRQLFGRYLKHPLFMLLDVCCFHHNELASRLLLDSLHWKGIAWHKMHVLQYLMALTLLCTPSLAFLYNQRSRGFLTNKPRGYAPTIKNRRHTSSSGFPFIEPGVARSSPSTLYHDSRSIFLVYKINSSFNFRKIVSTFCVWSKMLFVPLLFSIYLTGLDHI